MDPFLVDACAVSMLAVLVQGQCDSTTIAVYFKSDLSIDAL